MEHQDQFHLKDIFQVVAVVDYMVDQDQVVMVDPAVVVAVDINLLSMLL
tara:strand:- start:223 stop:369 length:147 start_codon:yes stop_codon:yes gene_type:complete